MVWVQTHTHASYAWLTCVLSALVSTSAGAQGVAAVEGGARAKAVVLLRATIPSVPCPRYTTLKVAAEQRGAEDEVPILVIEQAYVEPVALETGGCSMLVPAFAGPTDYHHIWFAFSDPGVYHVRWEFGSTGVSPVDFAIEQTVRIERPTAPDLTFLDRVGGLGFLERLFGRDLFESMAPEFRAWVRGRTGAARGD